MTKKVIAIISVLKPVDDTRNYEKIARSLSNTNKYAIKIIGFSTINIPTYPNIEFHPIFNFKRNSIKRIGVGIKMFRKLLKLKPELIIVTTPELLLVSIAHKIIFGSRIVYDIQENYFRNLIFTNTYPTLLKYPIGLLVRSIERVSHFFIDTCFLAEKVYMHQMKYCSSKAIIIENKALIPNQLNKVKQEKIKDLLFVYSGTIASHYGIFDAIDFISSLKETIQNVKLVIIGFAAQDTVYQKLHEYTKNKDFINIIGGDTLVPHDQILIEMSKSDFCLLPYQKNQSIKGRIPTKLFECLAMEIPVIITPNAAWESLILKNNAGIIHDFKSVDALLIKKLQKSYYGNNLSNDYDWRNSSDKLIDSIQRL